MDALAGGLSTEKAARRYDLMQIGVRRMLREATDRCRDGAYLRETWTLEDRRLRAVGLKFFYSRLAPWCSSERRATHSANMPQSHVLQVLSTPPAAPVLLEDTARFLWARQLRRWLVLSRAGSSGGFMPQHWNSALS